MRTIVFWRQIKTAIERGAAGVLRHRGGGLLGVCEIEEVVSDGLLDFWRTTCPELPHTQQLRRAHHFGVNKMRNHLRARLRVSDPLSPRRTTDLESDGWAASWGGDIEAAFLARESLSRLAAYLSDEDWRYLMALAEAGDKASLARTLGVSRAAVTRRVQRIRARASRAIEP